MALSVGEILIIVNYKIAAQMLVYIQWGPLKTQDKWKGRFAIRYGVGLGKADLGAPGRGYGQGGGASGGEVGPRGGGATGREAGPSMS